MVKQARIFQLLNVDELDSIEEALEPLEFKPCLPRLPFTYGWVSPLDQEAAPLAHTSTQYVMLCMQLEEKYCQQPWCGTPSMKKSKRLNSNKSVVSPKGNVQRESRSQKINSLVYPVFFSPVFNHF